MDAGVDLDLLSADRGEQVSAAAEGAHARVLERELAERADVVDQEVHQAELVEEACRWCGGRESSGRVDVGTIMVTWKISNLGVQKRDMHIKIIVLLAGEVNII